MASEALHYADLSRPKEGQAPQIPIPWLFENHEKTIGQYFLAPNSSQTDGVNQEVEFGLTVSGRIPLIVRLSFQGDIDIFQCSQPELAKIEEASLVAQYIHPEFFSPTTAIVIIRGNRGQALFIKQAEHEFNWGLKTDLISQQADFFYPDDHGEFSVQLCNFPY